jgi:putative transposase
MICPCGNVVQDRTIGHGSVDEYVRLLKRFERVPAAQVSFYRISPTMAQRRANANVLTRWEAAQRKPKPGDGDKRKRALGLLKWWCVHRPKGGIPLAYANQLRRRRPRPGDKWHLDEVFVRINDKLCYLWRAVDQHGIVLDVLVQSRRNAKAAKRFFRKLLKGLRYVPRVLVTDKLASYRVAHRELMSSVKHRRSRYLNNRAENSHQPARQRERAMKRFKWLRHAQRFLSAFSDICAHFRPRRHLLSATQWRTEMADRFAVWRQVTGPDAVA